MEKAKGKVSRRYDEDDEDEEGMQGIDQQQGEEEDLGLGDMVEADQVECSPEDAQFDEIVGAMQEVLTSDEFNESVEDFHRKYCGKFVETEENTHEMWTLHKKFREEIESRLEEELKKRINGYSQSKFEKLLVGREDQIDEFVLDTLLAFDDFNEFKRQGLETKLRLMKQEEPEKYKLTVETHKDYSLVQEIAKALSMEDGVVQVKGGLGQNEVF